MKVVLVVLLLLFAGAAGYFSHYVLPCPSVDAYAVDADALLAQGWYGDPTDGEERLYAPTCR